MSKPEEVARADEQQLAAKIDDVRAELTQLNNHKLLRVYSSTKKTLFFNLLKGIAFGLGSGLGATVVVSLLVYLLSQIEFLPIVGEWVSEILLIIKQE